MSLVLIWFNLHFNLNCDTFNLNVCLFPNSCNKSLHVLGCHDAIKLFTSRHCETSFFLNFLRFLQNLEMLEMLEISEILEFIEFFLE